ncbi:cytochrome P450 6B6-like [Anticarsia gemmatalis]|uniref:cytochrome P450 6B6-like n=1 Tax=Anticarsia gemmatalis TaxID=129554 RepID=UPI003F75F62B
MYVATRSAKFQSPQRTRIQFRHKTQRGNMFLILLPLLLLLLYRYLTRNHDYWQKRNVKHEKPIPVFGSLYQNIMGKKSITEVATELYNKYPDEKVVGQYRSTIPELIVRDLDIARNILNVDFAYFYPRGLGRNPKMEPLFLNLFHVDGDSWKLLRQRLTAAFTTAKLKKMFPLVVECAEKLQLACEETVNRGGECDVRELMARFTTEFIAACGFGLQADCIGNQNSLFREFGKRIFNRNRAWKNAKLVVFYDLFPDFGTLLQYLLAEDDLLETTTQIVKSVLNERNDKPSGRHDFIDLLMELRDKGTITGESVELKNPDGSPTQVDMEMDLQCMAAQVFIFFAAGFETSSSATSYLLHELAFHPEEQEKIQQDIDQVLAKYDNKLCYDAIAEMSLLSMAFKEAMRKFPSLGTLHRICARRYTIPELGITLDPGVRIIIPVQAIQNDEKYFDNPSQFKPERFADTSVERNKYCYLPFGEGPRMCIGARLGEMQSLAGLVALLHKFTVEPGKATKRELEVNHLSNVVQSIQGGIPLRLKLREKDSRIAA